MTSHQIAEVVVALTVVLAVAHALGYVFARLRQPKLVGEIMAGVLVGPWVLGRISPDASRYLLGESADSPTALGLGVVYWLGLLLLMFVSGSEVRRVFAAENRKPTAWILGVGTPLPFFLALGLGHVVSFDGLAGPKGAGEPIRLVVAIAVAVTSIPVISRIFQDLKILHTRFASLILGAALLEDIALWAVFAVASAIATQSGAGAGFLGKAQESGATIGFLLVGLFLAPRLLKALDGSRWNVVRAQSPTGYAALVLLGYASVAALTDVNMVFAAFLAGFGLVGGLSGSQREKYADSLEAIGKVASGCFVPVYFALVGSKLNFGAGFSPALTAAFLAASSLLCLLSVGLAAKLAGFRGLEIVNLAVASNARGGPGIVLASVAYEAQIIGGAFFTALVLTAVLTSQFAGWWLGTVLRRGWTLLREDAEALRRAPPEGGPEPVPVPSDGSVGGR